MSKCMVAFIDWYHERFDGEGGREKIKVKPPIQIIWTKFHITTKIVPKREFLFRMQEQGATPTHTAYGGFNSSTRDFTHASLEMVSLTNIQTIYDAVSANVLI